MATLELRPNRNYLNPNFNGYKTQLKEHPNHKNDFKTHVQRLTPGPNQYSFFHAKLFSTHNHLRPDKYDNFNGVYFFDTNLDLIKFYIDELTDVLSKPIKIFSLPKKEEQITNIDKHYYAGIYFASNQYAVASDGVGNFYILNTGDKRKNDQFEIQFGGKVLEDENQGFHISDALYQEDTKQLSVVLLHIEPVPDDRYVFIINWLTFALNENGKWEQIALRRLQTKGDIDYLHVEKGGQYIYIIREQEVKFIVNSEHPIQKDSQPSVEQEQPNVLYKWSQTEDELTVKYFLSNPQVQKNLIQVTTETKHIKIFYDNEELFGGELAGKIDARLTTWQLIKDSVLEIELSKVNGTGLWPEFVVGDQRGQMVLDTGIVEEIKTVMSKVVTRVDNQPQSMSSLNPQQMEECDFENSKSIVFERISGLTNEVTHRIDLGSHQVVIDPSLDFADLPTFGIRQGDDICLWQPIIKEDGSFDCKHEATLQALGYIQASKTSRKFTICSPNADYTIICGPTGHIFAYCQRESLVSTELKNRKTGEILSNTTVLKVFLVPYEILGIFPGNRWLHILTEKFILVLCLTEKQQPPQQFGIY